MGATEMPRLVVIGGGVAGLTAAFRLSGGGNQVVVLEAAPHFGGQIQTERVDGFTIERGAEGFVSRSTAVPALATAVGMSAADVISQATLRSYGYDGELLQLLQPGEAASFLGFQVAREDLGKGIRTLRPGMGALIDGLAQALRAQASVTLRTASPATRVTHDHGRLQVALDSDETLEADAVVVATPAAAAAELLLPLAGLPAAALANAPTLSSVTVELAFMRDHVQHSLEASGFVIALAAQRDGLRACTFTSSKFIDRAHGDRVSLRLFFRPSVEDLRTLDDASWIERAVDGLGRVLELSGEPTHAWVSRWQDALPVFSDVHRAHVQTLEDALAALPIALAGSALCGAGIDAAVQSGERAAERVKRALAR